MSRDTIFDMKGPESFNFPSEDNPLDPESKAEETLGVEELETPEETPEFDEGRINRERLRDAIEEALDNANEAGATTVEELRVRIAELADKFEDEKADNSVTPEEVRAAYKKISEALDEVESFGSGPQETTEEEVRERQDGLSEEEGFDQAA